MTLAEFKTLITNKYFIEITNQTAILDFTALTEDGSAIRNEATSAGVLVFFPTLHRIFVRGYFYGCDPDVVEELQTNLSELQTTVTSLGTSLGDLAGTVQTQGTNIQTNLTNINDLITRVGALEAIIHELTGSEDINEAINELIEAYLDANLDTRIDDLGYLKKSDAETTYETIANVNTIRTTLQQLQQDLSAKAAQSDFSALVTLLGTQNWKQEDGTVVTVINNLKGTTQTLTTDLSELSEIVSGIPKFDIQVVNQLPTTNISKSTIYLMVSPEDEIEPAEDGSNVSKDMFTEYIYINKNAGKTDEETGEPLPESYKWEKLGRQAFKMSQYLTEEEIKRITDPLVAYIDSIKDTFGVEQITQINTNKTNIQSLQQTIQSINTTLNSLIQNGVLQFTGEDINTTSDANSNTIAEDISNLQQNKLDASSLQWQII